MVLSELQMKRRSSEWIFTTLNQFFYKKNQDEYAGKVTVTLRFLTISSKKKPPNYYYRRTSTTSEGQSTRKEELIPAADPSPRHLEKSSKSLERAKVCNVEGVIDEISYAAIAKIWRGIIERARREELQHTPPEQSKPRILCILYTYEGAHATNLLLLVLRFYYLSIITFNKNDKYIKHKLEPCFHCVPIIWNLVIVIAGLIMKQFNNDGIGG